MTISERKGKEEWRKHGHAGRESVKRGREEERARESGEEGERESLEWCSVAEHKK